MAQLQSITLVEEGVELILHTLLLQVVEVDQVDKVVVVLVEVSVVVHHLVLMLLQVNQIKVAVVEQEFQDLRQVVRQAEKV
jgi:hypothetical protein